MGGLLGNGYAGGVAGLDEETGVCAGHLVEAAIVEGVPGGQAEGRYTGGFFSAEVTEGEVTVAIGALAIVHGRDFSINDW
jgi:hypothetical protein